MRIHAFASLCPRCLGNLLLSLLLLLTSPSVVQAAAGNEATAPDCAQAGLVSQPVAVQLTRTEELVQAILHSAAGDLPSSGCLVPLEFQIPEDARPRQAVWRDVEGRAVQADGTPDPAHPDPLLRLWIHPDGVLQYEVREAGVSVAHAALNLAVAWGTTAAANDLAVLDILRTALGLELDILKPIPEVEEELWAFYEDLEKLGARLDDNGRVRALDWHADHPYETYEDSLGEVVENVPMRGIHPPDVRTTWQLPSELGQLTALSRLALGGPLLTGPIPPELGQLANLEQLTLAGSRLTGAVPPELGQLAQLWKLELHDNRLTALPPELGQLAQLTTLTLAGNRLTELPPELGRLAQLRELGLAGNRLTELPPELGQLSSLIALDVQDNQLTNLPSLAGLRQLEYLDASGNRLTTLPPGLGPLPFLSHLDLSDNRFTTLTSAWLQPGWQPVFHDGQTGRWGVVTRRLVQLIRHGTAGVLSLGFSLKVLDLSGNQLTTLPPAIGRLRLEWLDLSDNQLTDLPPALGRLRPPDLFAFYRGAEPHLTLDLSGNQLTALPPALGRLRPPAWFVFYRGAEPHLTLDLSGNQLTDLPRQLDRHLVQLDLGDNRLTDLPAALFRLDRLHTLNLSGNQLGTVPPAIGDLATVVHLGLGDN